MWRCPPLKDGWLRWRLQTLQYGRSRQRAHSPSDSRITPQLVHEAPMTRMQCGITTRGEVRVSPLMCKYMYNHV